MVYILKMEQTDQPSPSSCPTVLRHGAEFLATCAYVGKAPVAPGTWGSLAALPLGWGIVQAWGITGLAIGIVASSLIGWWASAVHGRTSGQHDAGEVVIDEVAGQWIALLPAGLDPFLFAAAFVLFRAFDIAKPGPIGHADKRLDGGLGVMVDDLLAGVAAAALLWLGIAVSGYSGYGGMTGP